MSSGAEQQAMPTALVEEFGVHVIGRVHELKERVRGLQALSSFFPRALNTIADLGVVNEQLALAGRSDLSIVDRAPMMEIAHPQEVALRCSNFSPKFRFYTGRRETGELDPFNNPVIEPIPATIDEILALRHTPKFSSYEELESEANSNRLPALSTFTNHSSRPAFTRMLILFPEFTTSLVTDMSRPENTHRYGTGQFESHLYVAYQLMSRLVDLHDNGVLGDDGNVHAEYLRG